LDDGAIRTVNGPDDQDSVTLLAVPRDAPLKEQVIPNLA
jgi:hypothetical protein